MQEKLSEFFKKFYLSIILLAVSFPHNVFCDDLPPALKVNINSKLVVPVLVLKLSKKGNTTTEGENTFVLDETDESTDIFSEPLWIDGQMNPKYKEWYSSKLHNLIQYINLYAGRNTFLIMPTTTTDTLAPGTDRLRVGLNFSSVFFREMEGVLNAQFDYEVFEGYAVFNYGISDGVEVGLYARGFHYSAGRMDATKNKFEETIGLSAGGRGNFQNDQYAQSFKVNGEEVFSGKKNEVGFGDFITSMKFRFLEETPTVPSMALMTAVKLPTGDQDNGFGSGTTDTGASIILTKHFTKRLRTHLNLGAAKPGGRGNWPSTSTVYSFIPAVEYAFSPEWQAAFQINLSTSVFRKIDFQGVNGDSFNVGFALTRNLESGGQIHLYFMDELDNEGDTDYVFGTAFDLMPLFTKAEDEEE